MHSHIISSAQDSALKRKYIVTSWIKRTTELEREEKNSCAPLNNSAQQCREGRG